MISLNEDDELKTRWLRWFASSLQASFIESMLSLLCIWRENAKPAWRTSTRGYFNRIRSDAQFVMLSNIVINICFDETLQERPHGGRVMDSSSTFSQGGHPTFQAPSYDPSVKYEHISQYTFVFLTTGASPISRGSVPPLRWALQIQPCHI